MSLHVVWLMVTDISKCLQLQDCLILLHSFKTLVRTY